MMQIVKEGNKSNAIRKFKCKMCKTIFKTDEYRIGSGTGLTVSDCPVCGYVAYKCFFR